MAYFSQLTSLSIHLETYSSLGLFISNLPNLSGLRRLDMRGSYGQIWTLSQSGKTYLQLPDLLELRFYEEPKEGRVSTVDGLTIVCTTFNEPFEPKLINYVCRLELQTSYAARQISGSCRFI